MKIFKIESKFSKWKKKNSENVFSFWDNCIWKCNNKLPLLRRQYLSLTVNGLTNSPKILHTIKRNFFNPNCLHRDQGIWERCCRSALNTISARFPCYLWKGPLKQDLLDIYLTRFFGVRKFKNTSAMRVIFLKNFFKIQSNFRKWKKNHKLLIAFEIISSENVAISCLW